MRLITKLFFLFMLMPHFIFSQNKQMRGIDVLAGKLITNLRSTNKEKILLQTNKQIYGAGEIIWLKAFIVDSITNKLTGISKTLFIDLVNGKDSVINKVLLQANSFQTNAGIELNNSLPGGYYWLRAYTRKMLEENVNDITVKPVYIPGIENDLKEVTPGSSKENPKKTKDENVVINVYPEGGSIISGTNSTVAVKAHDKEGNPLVTSGIIKDNRDNMIANFSTNRNGLAIFSFSPKWYSKYSVYIKNKENYDSVNVLPRVNFYAAQLSVTEQNDQYIKTRVMLEDSIFTKEYQTYILGIHGDSVCFAGIGNGIYELNIPASKFPNGVSNLLLYNSEDKLLSIRNIYINKDGIKVSTFTNKEDYASRENVKLNIKITDADGKPVKAALAVSVNDSRITDTTNTFYRDTLKNYSSSDADLEMLTSVNNHKYLKNIDSVSLQPNQFNIDDNLKLSGIVVDNKKEPVPGQSVLLMSKGNNVFYQTDTTDGNGKFSFTLPDYDEGTEFNLQINSLQGQRQDYNIITDSLKLPKFITPGFLKKKFYTSEVPLAEKKEASYIDSVIAHTQKELLPPVTITKVGTKQEGQNKKIPSGVITQEMLQAGGANNVGDAVLRSGKFHLVGSYLMSGSPFGFTPSASDEPIVVMDGSQVPLGFNGPGSSPVLGYLKSLSTNDIEYIRVLAGTEGGSYGVRGGHGVIEIHTSSKVQNKSSSTAVTTINPKGFHVAPVFDMPDYSNKEIKRSKSPDLRTVIYWNGDVVTDDNGNAEMQFYTADLPAVYQITISGITISGEKIFYTTTIGRN